MDERKEKQKGEKVYFTYICTDGRGKLNSESNSVQIVEVVSKSKNSRTLFRGHFCAPDKYKYVE